MKKCFYGIAISIFIGNACLAQTFGESKFKFDGVCKLQKALKTNDGKGNDVDVFQCVNQGSSISIYRVNVISFKTQITDTKSYLDNLRAEYSALGNATITTLSGKSAVQCVENVTIQGHSMKQISISTLHKNKGITLVIVTNSNNYVSLINIAKQKLTLL